MAFVLILLDSGARRCWRHYYMSNNYCSAVLPKQEELSI